MTVGKGASPLVMWQLTCDACGAAEFLPLTEAVAVRLASALHTVLGVGVGERDVALAFTLAAGWREHRSGGQSWPANKHTCPTCAGKVPDGCLAG